MDILKIKNTPFYGELYNEICGKFDEATALKHIVDGGYFTETEWVEIKGYSNRVFSSIQERIKQSPDKKNVVLLTTGSFAPIHEGHVNMMEIAREHLTSKGYNVVGGIFSPDHNEYTVDLKLRNIAYSIDNRLSYMNSFLKKYKFYNIDYWNGLHLTGTVNFTRVIEKIQSLIKGADICYVCGGDNVSFVKTFMVKGFCTVIGRPSYDEKFDKMVKEAQTYPNSENIHFEMGFNDESSTKIRKRGAVDSFFLTPKKKNLKIRIEDDEWSFWGKAKHLFYDNFENIEIITTSKIEHTLRSLVDFNKEHVISLDKNIVGKDIINFDISRLYDYGGIDRIGYDSDDEVLNVLDKNIEYTVFDDDKCSGETERYVTNIFNNKGIKIKRFVYGNILQDGDEILDLKDFIENKKHGGLKVLDSEGNISRKPYVLPWVIPSIRASITDSKEFSDEIKKLW